MANFLFNEKHLKKVDSPGKTADSLIHEAVEEAKTTINQRKPGSSSHARITGIGFRYGVVDGKRNFGPMNHDGTVNNPEVWHQKYSEATNGNAYYYKGQKYFTSTQWGGGQSVDSVARGLTSRASADTELEIIALAEDEPALSYHVDVSTTAHPGNMYLRNNEPVYDTVHTRVTKGQWPAGNRLGATVWLNYEPGHGASAQPAKAVRHDFTINHLGDTNTPQFTPADFGWQHGWAIGTYWFDITIDKQNNMDAGVNTPDREQSETMILTNYGLNATTGAIKANAAVDNNNPVHDVVDVKEIKQHIPQGVSLKAKSILHYEPTGQGSSQKRQNKQVFRIPKWFRV